MIAAQIEHYYPGQRIVNMTPGQVKAYLSRIADIEGGMESADRQLRLMERKREGRFG
jgi:hypothetical protein